MLGRNSLTVITEDEMPLVALLLGTQRYLTPFAGISYGIVGKIAEHTIEQTAVTLHNNMLVGKKILESHLVRLSFQRRLTGYFTHHLRNVYRLEIYHIRTVIQPVQGRDVAEQRGETLALGITALQKLRLHLFVDMRIVEYRFQITLDTCHRSLQLVSDILGKLPLQYILFTSGGLYALIHLDDTLSYLAQLIVRELGEIFHLQTLVMVCLISKNAQFGNILSQTVRKTVEHDGKQNDGYNGKPDEMLVSLQRFCQIIIIR